MRWICVYATSKQISIWPTIDPLLMTNSSGHFKNRLGSIQCNSVSLVFLLIIINRYQN